MAVPDSSPRASAGVSVRIPQMLTSDDGTFFPPGCYAIPWGRTSGPVGLAPEALKECGCSCKVFSQDLPVCKVLVSSGIGDIPAGLGGAMRTFLAFVCVRCISRRCCRASSPRAWARSRRSGRALRLVFSFPCRPSAGRRVKFPQPPSSRSRIADSSLSCYRVIQVDAHAHSIRVGSWSGDSSMKALTWVC
jgi:hypothetical protein